VDHRAREFKRAGLPISARFRCCVKGNPQEPDVTFALDPRLERDTLFAGDLILSRVLVMNDQRFPWAILVPRREGLTEILDLPAPERAILMEEIASVAQALRDLAEPKKLNVAALGNVVAQLHVHVVARYETDPAWPGPVFGVGTAIPYEAEAGRAFVARLAQKLGTA
jgi:diadenosine tetraphosphate (Ap4A) HIT family hydrolase